jgi:DNA-binding NarL/FixJ family response regulator
MALVVADDHERERIWLRELLGQHFKDQFPLNEASNGEAAVAAAIACKPSLVFLDIEMPLLSGIAAAGQILERLPQTGIIILSNHSDEIWVRQLWKLVPTDGAFAYVLKDSTDQQVVDAARSVLAGDCWIHPRIQRILRRISSTSDTLTDGEFEVLAYIAMGLTDRSIAKRLYLTEKAIQARLKSVYLKLGIPMKGTADDGEFNHRCRAINTAVRRGLINKTELLDWESKL